jgi:hypothetical protein
LKRRFELPGKYTISQVRKCLGWLAFQMNKQSESMFFVDDLYSPQWGMRRRLSASGGVMIAVLMLASILGMCLVLLNSGILNYRYGNPLLFLLRLLPLPCLTSIWIAILVSSTLGGAKRLTTYQRGSRIQPKLRNIIASLVALLIVFFFIYIYVRIIPSIQTTFGERAVVTSGGLVTLVSVFFIFAAALVVFTNGLSLVIPLAYRLYLSARSPVPLRYPSFLRFAVERGLMRQVGRGYIFRHRTLLEYFAGLKSQS